MEYFDNGWVKQSVDPYGISTSYDYNELGQQTARTLTAADGSTSRTMAWSYFPDGKQASKSDEGAPVGSNVTLVDNTDAQSTSATGTWATASVEGEQGFNHRTHAAGTGSDAFTWNLDVPADGTYDLYATYPQVTGAASGAKYQLTHDPDGAEGTQPAVVEPAVTVNQATGAGAWRKLATYALSANESASLKLAVSSTGTVVADGVKLVRDNSADTDTEQKTFTYDYDVNGNLTGIADDSAGASVSSYEMVYDELNQVASVTENATAAVVTAYGYNPNGQPLTVDHPDQAAEYGYDLRNLVKTVTVTDTAGASAGDPTTTSYTYDERGSQVTQTKGNGNVVTNAYFNDGTLRSMREETSGGALVASHEYTYNENGSQATDVASKRNADTDALMDSTTSYTYDPVDRLVEKDKSGSGASSETYVHDDNANVVNQTVGGTTTTYSYDRNRLQSATVAGQTGSASYTYDPFGRQASVTAAGHVISRNTYDGFDHVVKSEQVNDAGTLEATTYAFDPLDRTTSKSADGETTRLTYLGLSSEVLTEDVAGQLAKSFQYSPWGQRLSQVTHPGAPDEGDGDGEPEVGTAFYGYNAHTDVETLTNEAGNTVATYGYTAYGKVDDPETTGIDKPNPASPEAEPFNTYRYNSKRFDANSGTYDMGFRNYDPGLNRFTSRDMYNGALADLGLGTNPYTGNRYTFGAGNPIGLLEFDGHEPRPIHAAAQGGPYDVSNNVEVSIEDSSDAIPLDECGFSGTENNPEYDFDLKPGKKDPLSCTLSLVLGQSGSTQRADTWEQLSAGNGERADTCMDGDADDKSAIFYGSSDSMFRATGGGACLNPNLMPPIDRRNVGTPKGFVKNSGMNRTHLIARYFGGTSQASLNIVPTAKYANQAIGSQVQPSPNAPNSMRYWEMIIERELNDGNRVYYSANPVYNPGEIVPNRINLYIQIQGYGRTMEPTISSGLP